MHTLGPAQAVLFIVIAQHDQWPMSLSCSVCLGQKKQTGHVQKLIGMASGCQLGGIILISMGANVNFSKIYYEKRLVKTC